MALDGLNLKGYTQSESDREKCMPTAELILDSSEKLISITVDAGYSIIGTVVEFCTCTRHIIYTPNDIAYIQDIEALNKKIVALAEQSHSNNIASYIMNESIRDEFATVDEVNTVLTNYVQIKDLPPITDTSEFIKNLPINYTVEHIVGDMTNELKCSDQNIFRLTNLPQPFVTNLNWEWTTKNQQIESAIIEVFIVDGSIAKIDQPDVDFVNMDGSKLSGGTSSLVLFPDEYITYSNKVLTMRTDGNAIMGFSVRSAIRFFADNCNISNTVVFKTNLTDYALKSELLTIPDNLVNSESLTNTLNDYYTKKELDQLLNDDIYEIYDNELGYLNEKIGTI